MSFDGRCGMADCAAPKYHPFAACLMFRGCRDGKVVQNNLRAVVEYGMEAERAGVSLEEAMSDVSWRQRPKPAGEGE